MSIEHNSGIRNIAIIAHVDHGKTTLVDHLFRQSGTFRVSQEMKERVMDNMALEMERGITISAKNCSVRWNGIRINILDTPGHADFGGEVERALAMVEGAILLVDAAEGPLPQTRFVLQKALERNISIIVVINKIDRADARPAEVLSEIYDMFIDLDAEDRHIDFPVLYAIGREGIVKKNLDDTATDLHILFDAILEHIPAPSYDTDEPFQMLVCDLDYSDYLGRLAIGRVVHGNAHVNEKLVCVKEDARTVPLTITRLQIYEGVVFAETPSADAGDIVILAGIDNVAIGDTIATEEHPKALPRLTIDPPTVSMEFSVNTSPLAGRDGTIVQASRIWERLQKEALRNVGIKVERKGAENIFMVKGRGELQMAIIVETMRREGFELSIGRPTVIYKMENGVLCEPIEHVFIDCDEAFVGVVSEKLSRRKGKLAKLINHGARVRLEFFIPSRSLIGYRNQFLTDTKGTGIMSSYLKGYEPHYGDYATRFTGSLVADRTGNAIPYAIFNLEPRGRMLVQPGDDVYEGMVVGEHNKDCDLDVNICRGKKLTNIRTVLKDENVTLTRVQQLSLEKAIEFIRDDEIIEVTPLSIRVRKIILQAQIRNSKTTRILAKAAPTAG
ncbi:MAG: translational GTPase TypA [Spirochaetes bacterium]|nr:translational GTPase TypA [Spirochaetota bacterium]